MKNKNINPGSDEAIKQGCKCPVLDNARGLGYMGRGYVIRLDCPIHNGGYGHPCNDVYDIGTHQQPKEGQKKDLRCFDPAHHIAECSCFDTPSEGSGMTVVEWEEEFKHKYNHAATEMYHNEGMRYVMAFIRQLLASNTKEVETRQTERIKALLRTSENPTLNSAAIILINQLAVEDAKRSINLDNK